MKRRPRRAYGGARYPDLGTLLRSRRAAGIGLVVGAVAMAGCRAPFRLAGEPTVPGETGETADSGPIPGDMRDTAVETLVHLPSEGVRHVVFADPWGEVDYRLEILAETAPAAEAILTAESAVLDAVDQKLLGAPITTYEPGSDLGPVQASLRLVVAEAAGIAPERVADLVLVIERYVDEGDVPGDMGATR